MLHLHRAPPPSDGGANSTIITVSVVLHSKSLRRRDMTQRNVESNGSRLSEAAAGGVGKMKDQLSDVSKAAGDTLDSARQFAADKLHGAADTVRQGGEAVASATHSTAERLASS